MQERTPPDLLSRIAARYGFAGPWDRFHVRQRLKLARYDALLPHLPASGRVLDVGCGFGLLGQFLAETRPGLGYAGTDIDTRKIALARQSFSGQHVPPLFVGDVRNWPDCPTPVTAIALLDVLYLLPETLQQELFDFACQMLAPGPEATLLVKLRPLQTGASSWGAFLQESLMVHLLRRTHSSGALFTGQDPDVYASWGRALGFACCQLELPTVRASVLLVFRRGNPA
jgi:SAM-dependent methyltransferase